MSLAASQQAAKYVSVPGMLSRMLDLEQKIKNSKDTIEAYEKDIKERSELLDALTNRVIKFLIRDGFLETEDDPKNSSRISYLMYLADRISKDTLSNG